MKYILLITLFLTSSCSSYINSLHKQIDREEKTKNSRGQKRSYDPYGAYRGLPKGTKDRRPINNPVTLGGNPNSSQVRNMPPHSNRSYGKRRVKADDLKDNQSSGSLWTGKNSESFLFVTNNLKRQGDFVIVQVMESLKDKIQDELKRTFPDPRPVKGKKTATATPPEEAKAATTPSEDNESKVHDKISTQVVEEVNKDYLLVRGRKEVMFKKRKRFIEFQALVSRKDISSTDEVKSNRVLEPKVSVLRY
jgi:flagellar basal body L-ring protein FlgH